MNPLMHRLERLEAAANETAVRFVWRDAGDDDAAALARIGGLRPGEVPVFVSWATE
jgi:hypothetical protein